MASESSVTDQSTTELTWVKKLGDDTKEEEKHESEDVSVADEINKEEEHKQVSSSSESALETNDRKSNDVVEIFTSKEPVNSVLKQEEDLKAAEVAQTSENEINQVSSNDKAEIELVESEDSKDDVHELVHTEVPIVVFPDASEVPEEIDVDRSTLTSISVPVKNLEPESGSPEEHKSEESAETKPDLELIKSISAVDSEAPEENSADSITPTAIEVPLKDPERSSASPEEKKLEEHGETKEHVELSRSEECKEEVHELVPTEVSINAEASEKSDVDSSPRAIVEVLVKDFEVVSSSPEKQKAEMGAESEVKELIKSGYSKVEGQELLSEEVPTDISEEVKKNDVHLSVPTGAEVPLKDLEVQSGSPEEQKLEEGVETKVDIELIESGESKDEGQDLVSGEVPTNTSEAPEENDIDLSAPTSTVVPVKTLEVESSSPGEQKPEVGAETQVNIKLIESGDSKVEDQESVSVEVPAEVLVSTSEERGDNNTDLSTPTSIEVPAKDPEVESGSPEEQKTEESTETKAYTDFIKSGESKDEGLASGEVPTGSSQAREINDVDLSIPTSTEVPMQDLEIESSPPEEKKPEEGAETKANIKLIESGDSKAEGQESVSAEVPAEVLVSTSEERGDSNTDLSTPTSIEVPVKDLEVEFGTPEEQKIEENAETKAYTDFIKTGESKDEGLASGKVPTGSSQAPQINDVDLSIPSSTEVPMKDLEVESGSPEEQKSEEGAETKVNIKLNESGDSKVEDQESVSAEVPASTSEECEDYTDLTSLTGIEAPVQDLEVESGSPEEQKTEESIETKVNTDFIKSGESKDEGQASGEVPTSSSQAPEIIDVDLSIPTSTEVPVKDLEVESGSPEEQKSEVGAETKVNIKLIESGDSKVEGQEPVFVEVPASTSEEHENNNTDLSTPTGIEVPVKDLEVEFGTPEEQKIEENAETKVNTDFIKTGESKDEGQASGEVPTSSSQASEINDVDLSIPTSTEVPVKDLEVESGSPEEQKSEGAETKVNIKLIELGDSKVEGQESVSAEVPAEVLVSTFEERGDNNTDLSTATSIEVPVKDLEVESGSPDEQKIEESTETKVNTDFIETGESKDEGQASGEVPTSSSQAREINDVDLSIPTSIEVPVKDLEVEFGTPDEQKIEENAETEVNTEFIKTGESKDEGEASGEVPTSSSQAREINDVDLGIPTSTEVPVKDLEVESGSPEEQKPEEGAETNVSIKLIESGYSEVEGQESISAEVPASLSEELQENKADLSIPTVIEVPLKDLEVEFGYPEEKKFEGSAEIKVNTDFIKSGEFKDEGQDLVSGDVPTNTSEAPEIEAVDLSAPTSTEILVKDLEVESGSPVEQKSDANIELLESGDSKVEGQEFVFAEVSDKTSNAPKKEDVELSTSTSTEVPLKDLEIKSGFPEEQKLEESEKTNVDIESLKLGDSKDEGQESVFTEVSTNVFEEHEHNNVDLTSPTSTEVPVEDLEVGFGFAEEQNPKESVETKEPSSDVTTIDGGGEVAESSSYEDKSSGAGEVVDKEDEGLKEEVIHTRIEEDQTPDEDKVSEAVAVKKDHGFVEQPTVLDVVPPVTEVFPDEVLEESKDETSEVDNTDTAPKVSEVSLAGGNVLEEDVNVEAIEKDLAETSIDSSAGGVSTGQANIPENVEVEPLELKFEELDVSPEIKEVPSVGERVSVVDEKSETSKGEERKDAISKVDNTDTAQTVSEVSSAVGNVLEKDVNVESIERDLSETSIDSAAGSVSTEQAKIRETVEVEPLELKFEELNVSLEASEVPSLGERVSTRDENSESSKGGEMKDEISEADNTGSTPKVSEVSSAVGNVLEKELNVGAIERDLAETDIYSTVDGVSTKQAKISENVEVKPLELKFEELNPEDSQVPSVGESVSACDEKSESSKGERGVTLVETPSLAHLVEEMENDSSEGETEASVEQFPEAVKEIIASESYKAKKDETSRDVSLEEKNVNVNQDKKSEVKVEGVMENSPEHEELGIEKREGEKPKDEEPILSSDTRGAKLIKETTKRDSNIFAKVKRSIIKAKKAILGKSPAPKTVSSESKDENI